VGVVVPFQVSRFPSCVATVLMRVSHQALVLALQTLQNQVAAQSVSRSNTMIQVGSTCATYLSLRCAVLRHFAGQ
jgi:hypothetical protein